MYISLTSPVALMLLSSSLATSVNSLVKKMSSGITGIYTSSIHQVQLHKTVLYKLIFEFQKKHKSELWRFFCSTTHNIQEHIISTSRVSPGKANPPQTPSVACSGSTFLHLCPAAFSYKHTKVIFTLIFQEGNKRSNVYKKKERVFNIGS